MEAERLGGWLWVTRLVPDSEPMLVPCGLPLSDAGAPAWLPLELTALKEDLVWGRHTESGRAHSGGNHTSWRTGPGKGTLALPSGGICSAKQTLLACVLWAKSWSEEKIVQPGKQDRASISQAKEGLRPLLRCRGTASEGTI